LPQKVGERRSVEDIGGRVANLAHDGARSAGFNPFQSSQRRKAVLLAQGRGASP
jgi:hypothetical protein